jgi:hypothetical protein
MLLRMSSLVGGTLISTRLRALNCNGTAKLLAVLTGFAPLLYWLSRNFLLFPTRRKRNGRVFVAFCELNEQNNMNSNAQIDILSSPQVGGTEALFQLIESKLHLLKEMKLMSIEQGDLVAQHEMSGLMALLSRKQELMESLNTVQQALTPFQSQDPESRSWSSASRRKECQAMIVESDELLKHLIVMEGRSLDGITIQRELTAAQLQQNVTASTVQHAYQTSEEESIEGYLSIEG